MGHFLPFYVRYAAHFGFDGIWLDLEHRALDPSQVQALISLCYRNDLDAMVRVPTAEPTGIYRMLEEGAAGVMIPLVSDAAAAERAVMAAKFPPVGNRGFDGAGLDADFGLEVWRPDTTYFEDANRETFVMVQIETIEAVKNIKSIAAVAGIDALFVGPGDLSRRLEVAGWPFKLEEAIEIVAAEAKKNGKAWGSTAPSLDVLKQRRQQGAQMVPWGGDFAVIEALKQRGQDLDALDNV